MLFSTILGVLAAVSSVIASPLASTPNLLQFAGVVVTDKDVNYELTDRNEIKAFDGKVDNGNYPHPDRFHVKRGFHCIFYREASRGVGTPVGEFVGPATGSFQEWVAFYKCFVANGKEYQVAARAPGDDDEQMIPCGKVTDANGIVHDLMETTKEAPQHAQFTVNGVRYEPWLFHVADTCTCNFFSTDDENKSLGEIKGPTDPVFKQENAGSYLCWINVSI